MSEMEEAFRHLYGIREVTWSSQVSSTMWQVWYGPGKLELLASFRDMFQAEGVPLGVRVPSLRPMYYNRNIGKLPFNKFSRESSVIWFFELHATSATQNASVNVW